MIFNTQVHVLYGVAWCPYLCKYKHKQRWACDRV